MTTPPRSRFTASKLSRLPTLESLLSMLEAIWTRRWSRRAFISIVLGAVLMSIVGLPAQAFQVQVSPNNPQLGDTLTVIVGADGSSEPPSVVMNQQTYPAFAIANGRFRTLLPTSPLSRTGRLEIQVSQSGQTQNLAVGLRDRAFPTQRITVRGGGSDGTDHEFDRVDAFKEIVSPAKLWSGPFLRPNQGPVTSEYGVRRYYNGVFAQDYYHRGVDYGGGVGSPVVAPAAGRVVLVGRESEGFRLHGNTVGLDHGQGVTSIYLHLSRIDVQEGDLVQPGQRLGAVGATGAVTGPHLHWGLFVHGVSIDPVPWRYDGFE